VRAELHAEWTKIRTTSGAAWLLLGTVVMTIALSAAAVAAVTCPKGGCAQDITKLSLTGVVLGQAAVAVLGVLMISGEYRTNMIHSTFTAMPRRWDVLGAKAFVLTGLVLGAGAIAVLGSLLAGSLMLPGSGFTIDNGYPPISLTNGPTLRAATGSVLYLALIALLGLGIATAVREPAIAIGAVLGLLYLFPILITVATDPDWQRHLKQIAPMNAGLAVQATVDLDSLPIAPWAGLGVLTAWATAAVIGGGLLQQLRDA
jgi:ABC-2 type transport system permease protein